MRLVRKSLAHKTTFLVLAIFGVTAAWYVATLRGQLPTFDFTIGQLLFILYLLAGALLYFFVTHVIRPLRAIVREVRALKSGQQYNKVALDHIDEFGTLANFFNEIVDTLERVRTDLNDKRRLTSELEFATKVQRQLLPKKMPVVPGLDIVVKTRSATEIGGDSFDIIPRANDTVFYIGDATGHGSPAGILMAMVNVLIHTLANVYTSTRDIAIHANHFLAPKTTATMFMTLVLLRWEHAAQKLFYTGCGHEHILVYRAAKGTVDLIKSGGIALAMFPDMSKIAKEAELPLAAGDTVVLFTDGVTEAVNPTGEMFGIERLRAIVAEYGPKSSADSIFAAVSKSFSAFVGHAFDQRDDITLLVLKYNFKGVRHAATLDVDTSGIAGYERQSLEWKD